MTEINLENLFWIPIVKEEVWDALQNKNYRAAQDNLEKVLHLIPPPEWEHVLWTGIWEGFPFLRGDLNEGEWKNNVRPILARAVLNVASGEALSNTYKNLLSSSGAVPEFQQALIASIPGTKEEEKIAWLKMYRSAIYTFLVGTPAQDLGIYLLESARRASPAVVLERYQSLPHELREEVLRYATAEDFFRICAAQHLPEEKISCSAQVIGRVLMGFIHADDTAKEIQTATGIDLRITEIIAREVNIKLFTKFESVIRAAYDPINLDSAALSTATPERLSPLKPMFPEISKVGLAQKEPALTDSATTTAPKGEGPLVLHTEKPMADEVKKGFKGFSFPLSFIKPRSAEAPVTPIARVETPLAKKDEPRTVHYSENRTPVSPFGQSSGEFINLETFEKFAHPSSSSKVSSPTPTVSIKPSTEMAPPLKETPVIIATPPAYAGKPTPTEKPILPPEPKKMTWSTAPQAAAPQVAPPQIVTPQPAAPKPATLEGGEPKLSGNTVDLR